MRHAWSRSVSLAAVLAFGLVGPVCAQTTRPSPEGGGAEAIIYRDRDYSGPAVSSSGARADLGLAWNVRSIRIQRGTWELCSRPNFEGRCTRHSSSRNDLPSAQRAVQSMRPVYQSGWELVGERHVKDKTDRDTIISWGHAHHRRIRICVEGHAVRFYDVEVVFLLSGRQKVPVRAFILNGQCTRDIDLDGGSRDIAMINLVYETVSLGQETATVQVFAQQ
jgi:hypothetical protein